MFSCVFMWIHMFCLCHEFDTSCTESGLVWFHWNVSSCEKLVISRQTRVDKPNLFTESGEFTYRNTWIKPVELVNSHTEHVKSRVAVCWELFTRMHTHAHTHTHTHTHTHACTRACAHIYTRWQCKLVPVSSWWTCHGCCCHTRHTCQTLSFSTKIWRTLWQISSWVSALTLLALSIW